MIVHSFSLLVGVILAWRMPRWHIPSHPASRQPAMTPHMLLRQTYGDGASGHEVRVHEGGAIFFTSSLLGASFVAMQA